MLCNTKTIKDWYGLPGHLLDLILEKINSLSDVANFASVCTGWNSVFMHTYGQFICQNQVPMLMIPTKDESRRSLFCITENKTLGFQLKVPYNKRCSGSSHGWLAFAEDNIAITLYNPVSGATIRLPPVTRPILNGYKSVYDIKKVVLSADPSIHPDSYQVAVKYSCWNELSFIKAGEKKWTPFPLINDDMFCLSDMIYCKGKIYATTREGKIVKLDTYNMVTEVIARFSVVADHAYIAELSFGDLVIILRYIRSGSTIRFEVYKLGLSSDKTKENERVYSLDGDALFLGDNCSVSYVASNFPKCKPDCIYFSDDFNDVRGIYEFRGARDMGIFNIMDESFEIHYSPNSSDVDMPPPLWFVPNFTLFFSKRARTLGCIRK